jgi:putative chitinase
MGFDFEFTTEDLGKILTNNREIEEWFDVLNTVLPEFGISTLQRVAAFLAQCSHESSNLTTLHENLNYSAERLHAVFPRYFPTVAAAEPYSRQPEKIANKIYGGRMGNGDEDSGDGYKFRGRGILQITGRANYKACSLSLFGDERLVDDPSSLETKEGAVQSACWFWNAHNLNALADEGDIREMTHKINGGDLGLEDRMARYEHTMRVLEA